MHTLSRACCKRCGASSSIYPLYLNEITGTYLCSDCIDDLQEEHDLQYEGNTEEPDDLTWEDN